MAELGLVRATKSVNTMKISKDADFLLEPRECAGAFARLLPLGLEPANPFV
jgi:hypothetical protein